MILLALILLAQASGVTPLDDATVGGTAVMVRDSSAFRESLSCTNTSSTTAVRWGSSTVSATKGQRFPANSSIEIRNRGQIWMISEGGNVTITCTEETK